MRFTLLFLFLMISRAEAHPVIHKDGLAISSFNMPSYAENYLMYSFSNKMAAGLGYYRFSQDDLNTEVGLLKLNYLLYRHNGAESQANIYLHGGAGLGDHEIGPSTTSQTYLAGVEADWETRKLYTSLKHFEFYSPKAIEQRMTQARIGFSPILSDFKDLQTWFMLQGMYTPETDANVMITPMLRFFYHNVLWEMGSSFRGEWMLNFMIHY